MRGEFRGRALVVLAGLWVCQMGLGCGYVFGVVLKKIVADFEWSRAAFGAANVPVLLAMAASAPMVGWLVERIGARAVLAGGGAVIGLALWLFGRIDSLGDFYAASALFGVGMTGVGDVATGAVAARWFGRRRGAALALVYTGSNVGGMIVPVVAASIAASGSWRTAVAAIGGAAAAVIVPFALLTVREPETPLEGSEPPPADPARPPGPDLDLLGALRTRTFWVLAFALWSFYLYYLSVTFHLVPFLSDLGFSDARAAASLGGAVGLGVLSKLGMGLVADRISERTALRANFALVAVASLLLLGAARPALLVAFLVAHGVAVAAENVVLPLVVAQSFGVRHLASIYGALMVTLFLGGAPGPWFAGRIFDTMGDYRPAFAVFAVLNVLGWLALFGVRHEVARAGPAPAAGALAVSE